MAPPEARWDLVEGLLQSMLVLESSRARLLAAWAGEFSGDADNAAKRADRLLRLVREMQIDLPAPAIVDGFADSLRTVCGAAPADVHLGAAFLARLGAWPDTYAGPYLADDAEEFAALGRAELRFPAPARTLTEDEAVLASGEPLDRPRFAILTDIHVGNARAEPLARRAVADINQAGVDFVVVPGDITDDGEPEQFALAKQILDELDAPVHVVLGNHDTVRRSTRAECGAELFADAFGYPPRDVVLRCGELQVALVDTSDPTACPFPDWDLAGGGFRDDSAGVWSGALREGQPAALADSLDPARPTLLVQHHELQPFTGFLPISFGLRGPDSDALLGALSEHRIVGVVAGHTHRSAATHVGPREDVPQLEVPAIKDWPFCWALVSVSEDAVVVSTRQIDDRGLVWHHAEELPPIIVNFMLGPQASLEHRFDL